jgi:hypothetical protein
MGMHEGDSAANGLARALVVILVIEAMLTKRMSSESKRAEPRTGS